MDPVLPQRRPRREDPDPAPARLSSPPRSPWRMKWLVLALVVGTVGGLDLGTKHLAQQDLQYRPGRRVVLVEGYLALTYVRNPGAAWGLLSRASEDFRRPFFIGISLLAMAFILYLFLRLERGQVMLLAALSLVMAGAIGNFADRLRFDYVVDFIDVHLGRRFKWPTFNVADVAITVGVVLLLVEMFVLPRLRRRAGVRGAAVTPDEPGPPGEGPPR